MINRFNLTHILLIIVMVLSSINISTFVLRYFRKLGEAGETVRKVGGKDK